MRKERGRRRARQKKRGGEEGEREEGRAERREGMRGERLPNTVHLLIALPFFNLGKQNELRLDKFGISRLHSTWTFTI